MKMEMTKEKKKFVNLTVDVELTQEELVKLGEEAGQLNFDLAQLELSKNNIEAEKKSSLDKVKGEISELTSQIRSLLSQIKNKTGEKVVSTEVKYNMESKEVEYWYGKEIVKHRPMEPSEMQKNFDFVPEKPEEGKIIAPKWLKRTLKVDYKKDKEEIKDCTIVDIKVKKNKEKEIVALEVKTDKIKDYVDYSFLSPVQEKETQDKA